MLILLLSCNPAPDVSLLDPETCRACHPTHVEQWEGSMHAYAGQDPVFRAMMARGQRDADLGDFCITCHAPVALALGEVTDGSLDDVPEHLQGVTCAACHGITDVHRLNNAGFDWVFDGTFRGALANPQDNDVHGSAYSPLQDRNDQTSSDLCGSCHDVVTPAGVELERTYAQWADSVFASPTVGGQSCGHCHMPGRDGTTTLDAPERRLHDHSMAAVDLALDDFPHREVQRDLVEQELAKTLLAGICVQPAAGGSEVVLLLENASAGHHFPSGASHDRRVIGTGQVTLGGVDLLGAPWTFGLHDLGTDENGDPAHLFWEVREIEERGLPAVNVVGLEHVREWRQVVLGDTPDRVVLTVTMEPLGHELLDELIESGDLDPDGIDPISTLPVVTLEWTGALGDCVTSDGSTL